ncbi:MAG: hypothetical protein ACRCXC_12715 [Legionella sp.]
MKIKSLNKNSDFYEKWKRYLSVLSYIPEKASPENRLNDQNEVTIKIRSKIVFCLLTCTTYEQMPSFEMLKDLKQPDLVRHYQQRKALQLQQEQLNLSISI